MNDMIQIKYALINDFENIKYFLDNNFTKEGYGFLHSGQIETEIKKRRVIIALDENEIIGCRIGLGKLWNLSVKKEYRGKGIGEKLLKFYEPDIIRVKSDPVGHLSKEQKDNFKNPEEFYDKMGYKYFGHDYGKNFYQNSNGKANHHKCGEKKHIKVYVKKSEKFLF